MKIKGLILASVFALTFGNLFAATINIENKSGEKLWVKVDTCCQEMGFLYVPKGKHHASSKGDYIEPGQKKYFDVSGYCNHGMVHMVRPITFLTI
jgi:hypothetical protein